MPDTAPGRRPCPGSGCRVLNIDIGGGTSNYALFDAGNVSATACLNVGGRLLETDAQGAWSTRIRRGSGLSMRCLAPALTPRR